MVVAAGGLCCGAAPPLEPENLDERLENHEGLRESEGLVPGEVEVPVLSVRSELPLVKPGLGMGMGLACAGAGAPLGLLDVFAVEVALSVSLKVVDVVVVGAGEGFGDGVSDVMGKVARWGVGSRSVLWQITCN